MDNIHIYVGDFDHSRSMANQMSAFIGTNGYFPPEISNGIQTYT